MSFFRDALVHSGQNSENELLRRSWGQGHGQGNCKPGMLVLGSPGSLCSEIPALAGIAGPAADVFNHRAAEFSDQDRLMGDAVGLENASLGNTNGCWMMYTLPVPKLGDSVVCYTQMGTWLWAGNEFYQWKGKAVLPVILDSSVLQGK